MATQNNGKTAAKKNPTATKPAAPKVQKIVLLDVKGMDLAIKSIATRAKKLDSDVQIVALSAIDHLDKHGDTTFVNRLYLCMGKGARKSALAQWFMAHGKVSANVGDNKREQPFSYDKEKKTNMDAAKATPWYDFAPEPEVDEMFDITAALHRLVQRAAKSDKVNDAALLGRLMEIDEQVTAGHTVESVKQAEEQVAEAA